MQEKKQTQLNHIRYMDIETGVVRRMRLGFCEDFNEVWVSTDGKRAVAKRGYSNSPYMGKFLVCTL